MSTTTITTTVASCHLPWVLLNAHAYIDSRRNATTAVCSTGEKETIEASLWPACPPRPSSLFVQCFTPFGWYPRILCTVDDLLLLRVGVGLPRKCVSLRRFDYFIYRADPKRRSLRLLPRPHPFVFQDDEVGILPRGDVDFTIAALVSTTTYGVYNLHLFDSKAWAWSSKKVSVEAPQRKFPVKIPMNMYRLDYHVTTTVITLGGEGGTMGWVDLWRGILLCDVLHDKPTLRDIPVPLPMEQINLNHGMGAELGCPRPHRGIAFIKDKGCLKFVNLEVSGIWLPDNDDETRVPSFQIVDWKITTWSNTKMTNSWEDWHPDFTVKASEMTINNPMNSQFLHSELLHKPRNSDAAAERALHNLVVSEPVPSMDGEDVVYLMARVKFRQHKAWVLAVDMASKTLQGLSEFGTERELGAGVIYCASSIFSKYINPATTPGEI